MSLQTDEMNITVNDTESEVELSCEMTLFVREDQDLEWFRDGQMIENSGRRAVTYRDGTSSAAQRGGDTFIPGRVAVLTISNPVVEDSGTYTCEIARTSESLDVQLSVLPAGGECFQCQCIPEWNRIPSIVIRCSFSPLNIWEQDYTPPPPPPPPPSHFSSHYCTAHNSSHRVRFQ